MLEDDLKRVFSNFLCREMSTPGYFETDDTSVLHGNDRRGYVLGGILYYLIEGMADDMSIGVNLACS